jgi:hypothetical protein
MQTILFGAHRRELQPAEQAEPIVEMARKRGGDCLDSLKISTATLPSTLN